MRNARQRWIGATAMVVAMASSATLAQHTGTKESGAHGASEQGTQTQVRRVRAPGTTATFPAGKNEVRLPLVTNGSHIVLPVSVNGSEPLSVVLDTGMPMPGVFFYGSERVDALGLEYGGMKARIGGAGGGAHQEADIAMNVSLDIGGIVFEGGNAVVLPGGHAFASHHEGIIGLSVFQGCTVHVDHDKEEIVLYRPGTAPVSAGATEVPLEIKNNMPFVHADLTVGGGATETIRLVMDLGATHAVSLNATSHDAIEIPSGAVPTRIGRGLSGPLTGHVGRVSGLSLGGLRLDDVVATFPDPEFENPRGMDSRNGNLGIGFLDRFNFTIDYAGERMLLEKSKRSSQPFEWNMSGLSIEPAEESGLQVVEVLPDSPAARAGLQEGDVLAEVDGKPVSGADYGRLQELMRRDGAELSVRYRRDDESHTARLRLERLI